MKTITDWIALANSQQGEINGLRRQVAELAALRGAARNLLGTFHEKEPCALGIEAEVKRLRAAVEAAS